MAYTKKKHGNAELVPCPQFCPLLSQLSTTDGFY